RRDAQIDQMIESLSNSVECAFFAESADVKLVNDARGERNSGEKTVGPGKFEQIDMARRAESTLGLMRRARIGERLAPVDRQTVIGARGERGRRMEIAALFDPLHGQSRVASHDFDRLCKGGPHAKTRHRTSLSSWLSSWLVGGT